MNTGPTALGNSKKCNNVLSWVLTRAYVMQHYMIASVLYTESRNDGSRPTKWQGMENKRLRNSNRHDPKASGLLDIKSTIMQAGCSELTSFWQCITWNWLALETTQLKRATFTQICSLLGLRAARCVQWLSFRAKHGSVIMFITY